MKQRILVVADDAALRATLARWLLASGYAVELAESVKRAREVLAVERVALAILAVDRLAAADLARELLDSSARLIAVIEPEAVDNNAPSIPASGYVFKPLKEPDVLAQVESLLQCSPKLDVQPGPEVLSFEGYTLDVGGRAFFDPSGVEVSLTRTEFSLLLLLAQRAGRALSRDELRQAILGRNAYSDDRSVDMLISRLRRKIEPNPKAPRMIVTVPGVGYKFSVKAQAAPAADPIAPIVPVVVAAPAGMPAVAESQLVAAPEASVPGTEVQTFGAPEPRATASPAPRLRMTSARRWAIAGAVVVLASIAGLLIGFWHAGSNGPEVASAPLPKFDATVIPLVFDSVRAQLSSYEHEPDAKAIAISREGWGLSSGAAGEEAAKNEALDRCRDRDKGGFCRLYAIGDKVVWPSSTLTLPLPADIRTDGPMSLVVSYDLIRIWRTVWHVSPPKIVMDYEGRENHKAIAVAQAGVTVVGGRPTQAEAIRLAIEKCSDYARAPCLLLSVDGLWSVNVPQSYRITGPFTLAGEREMSEVERQQITQIYAGKDWRAVAKGSSGHWYAVSQLENELVAAEEVLKTCHQAEQECVLHAIGNWRVDEKLAGRG